MLWTNVLLAFSRFEITMDAIQDHAVRCNPELDFNHSVINIGRRDPGHQGMDTSKDDLKAARSVCYGLGSTAHLVECPMYDVAEDVSNATDDCSYFLMLPKRIQNWVFLHDSLESWTISEYLNAETSNLPFISELEFFIPQT